MSKKYLFLLLPVFLVGCGAQPNQSTQTGETQQSLSGTDQSIISGDVQDSLTGDQSDQISGDAQSSDKDSSKDVVKSDIKALHEKELAKIKKDTYFKTEGGKIYYRQSVDPSLSRSKDWNPVGKVINKFEYLSEVSKGNLAGKEMDIDLATFEPLGLQLAKDKNGIFYCGGNCGASEEDVCYRLPAIDVNSFEILNNTYLKDKNHIYNYGCMGPCQGIPAYTGFDAKTFKVYAGYYGEDKGKTYYCGGLLTGLNSKDFQFFDSKNLSLVTNGKDLYVGDFRLEGADLPTFQILSGDESGFDFRDKNYNYEVQSVFMGIDDIVKTPIKK